MGRPIGHLVPFDSAGRDCNLAATALTADVPDLMVDHMHTEHVAGVAAAVAFADGEGRDAAAAADAQERYADSEVV